MKIKKLVLLFPLALAPAVSAFAQIDCTNPANKLVCLFPLTSSNLTPEGSTQAVGAAAAASQTINASLATQLSQLPIPSSTVGVISLRKEGNEFGVPFDNLGPILTDRPDTVGGGHLYAGFNYQHFNFNAIDGIGLKALVVGYQFTQPGFTAGDTQTVYGNSTSDISFKLDQYVFLGTFGLTRTTDISAVVPINDVSLGAKSTQFLTYVYDSITGGYSTLNQPGSVQSHGTASGIGDVTFSAKQLIHGAEDSKTGIAASRTAVAIGGALRLPTGDALNYLGSGAYGFNVFALVEYRSKFSPHLKVSNQWNTRSRLVNNSATTSIKLPGGFQYDFGTDYRIHPKLTAAVDLLGSQFTNTPSLMASQLPSPSPTTSTPPYLNSVSSFNNTYTTANISGGLKWSPLKNLVLYGNVLKQMNNVGLRSDLVPLGGISYNVGKATR